MMEDQTYKTVYVTVDPDEWEKQKDPVRKYVQKALAGRNPVGPDRPGNDQSSTTEARVRRAVQKSLSSDFAMPSDCVPWQSVCGEEQADELLKQKRKQAMLRKHSSMRDIENGKNKRAEELKGKKKDDPTKQLKVAFFKVVNKSDPDKGYSKKDFDSHDVGKMMDKLPAIAKDKFAFSAFNEPIMALHMLCAINAPLPCIKKCFKLNNEALHDTSSTLGSPLHCACYYNADVESIRYLASKDSPALLLQNRAKRTPLHVACAAKRPSCELIQLLTAACAEATEIQDHHGLTPLHLAVAAKKPNLEIIEDLTEVGPDAVCMQDEENGATPVHLALESAKCDLDIVRDMIGANSAVLKVQDKKGRLPLHLAVKAAIGFKILKAMVKKNPKSIFIEDSEGYTPYTIARTMHQDKEVLKLLKPPSHVNMAY